MADQWYVGRNGQKTGPYTTEQLRQLAAAGQLVSSDLLWKQGLEKWVPITEVRGLLPGGGTLPPLDLAPAGQAAGRTGGDFDFRDGPAAGARGVGPDWNPYQASTAVASGPAATGIVYAEFFPRVGAWLLDAIFCGILSVILQFGLPIAFGVLSGGDEAAIGLGSLLGSLLTFLITAFYFVGYETSAKQGTWGKQIVGIKVTDLDGRPITTGQAVGRFFAKIISNLTCGIGYLMPLFTDRKQTLHDLICGCLALEK
jgi:uncharacterized RDD family membrane protein YckC